MLYLFDLFLEFFIARQIEFIFPAEFEKALLNFSGGSDQCESFAETVHLVHWYCDFYEENQ